MTQRDLITRRLLRLPEKKHYNCTMARFFNIQKIGETAIDAAVRLTGPYSLLYKCLRNIPVLKAAPVRAVFCKQIYFTGIRALKTVSLISIIVGIVIMTQVANITGVNSGVTGKILTWAVVRELGPLMTAIIVIARSCTATSVELGTMRLGGEIDSLKLMGIDPLDYLVVPRVAGITISLLVLTFYFQIFAVAGGLLASSMLIGASFVQQARTIISSFSPFEFVVPALKVIFFGLAVSSASCYHGLGVKSATEVPQAASTAVMQGLFFVFLLDGAITVATYL